METLGLSKSTPKSTSRWKEFFIPDLSSAPNARSACEAASLACFIIAGVTAIFALFTSLLTLIDAALFGLIGMGLRKASRTAALAGFLLYVAEQIYTIVAVARPAFSQSCSSPSFSTVCAPRSGIGAFRKSCLSSHCRTARLSRHGENDEANDGGVQD